MYQSHTAQQRKQYLQLPVEYEVDVCLIYGSRKVEEYTQQFINTAQDLGLSLHQEDPFSGFTQGIQSFIINDKRIWFLVEYGGVKLSEYLHLACLFGSKKNIFLGSCGGLKTGLYSGDIIVPNYSYGNESTTRMYNRSGNLDQYSNQELSNKLIASLHNNYTVHHGPIMTCGAMLAETQEDVDTRSQEGYLGVEMESATIFAISNYFSIPSGGMIYISDNLIEGQTVSDISYTTQAEQRNKAIQGIFTTALHNIYI